MNSNTLKFLETAFGEYYSNLFVKMADVESNEAPDTWKDEWWNGADHIPSNPTQREWGYVPFRNVESGRPPLYRHISLTNHDNDLNKFLQQTRPKDIYFSKSTYQHPGENNMQDKRITSTYPVFDLDSDSNGDYKNALSSCKSELEKLLWFLEKMFDVDIETHTQMYFSGGKGYHVHLKDPRFLHDGNEKWSDIVDYTTAQNVTLESISKPAKNIQSNSIDMEIGDRMQFISPTGWGEITIAAMQTYLSKVYTQTTDSSDKITVKTLTNGSDTYSDKIQNAVIKLDGIGAKRANAIAQNVELLYRGGYIKSSGTEMVYESLLESVLESFAPTFDEPVAIDKSRIIRLPLSLHGGTGFRVTPVTRKQLDSFNPFKHAVPKRFRVNENADIGVDVKIINEDYTQIRISNSDPLNCDLSNGDIAKVNLPIAIYHALSGDVEIMDEEPRI